MVSFFLLIAAYLTYGKWLAGKFKLDDNIKTPAHRLRDEGDYMPAKAPVVLGHHFASIAGAVYCFSFLPGPPLRL
ncbi:MAG: carbon starvation CstA family protein [Candidatus Rifleibacteriota bacterium]